MAPEVVIGNYNNKCDVWSIGIILYFLAYDCLPFEGDSDKEIINAMWMYHFLVNNVTGDSASENHITFYLLATF